MKIKTKEDINPEYLAWLRLRMGVSSGKFWRDLGYSEARGGNYERGIRQMSDDVKRAIYLHYVAGLPIDISASELRALLALRDAKHRLIEAANQATDAAEAIRLAAARI